jgi:hypothetical protein
MAARLSILATTNDAWRDAWRVANAFPAFWLASIAVYVALGAVSEIEGIKAMTEGAGLLSVGWALDAFLALASVTVLVPAALLSHRLILLGSRETPFEALGPARRARTYMALEAGSLMIIMVPLGMTRSLDTVESELISAGVGAFLVLTLVVALWFIARLAPVYPAVALDAERESLGVAFAASRGQVMRIVGIMAVSIGPLATLGFLAMYLGSADDFIRTAQPWRAIFDVVSGVCAVIWVAAMSNIYLRLAGAPAQPTTLA